jgi:archaemetzincin
MRVVSGLGVELVRVGAVAPALVRQLREDVAVCLAHPVWVAAHELPVAEAFSRDRQQYSADTLIAALQHPAPDDGVRRIGVTDVDLYLPVFAHVLGSAQLDGVAGIASTFRLHPEFSGEPADPHRLRLRLLKEVLHELGHTCGLVHCHLSWCVMSASLLPEHVDLKDPSYCADCAQRMGVPRDGILSFFLKGDHS